MPAGVLEVLNYGTRVEVVNVERKPLTAFTLEIFDSVGRAREVTRGSNKSKSIILNITGEGKVETR